MCSHSAKCDLLYCSSFLLLSYFPPSVVCNCIASYEWIAWWHSRHNALPLLAVSEPPLAAWCLWCARQLFGSSFLPHRSHFPSAFLKICFLVSSEKATCSPPSRCFWIPTSTYGVDVWYHKIKCESIVWVNYFTQTMSLREFFDSNAQVWYDTIILIQSRRERLWPVL